MDSKSDYRVCLSVFERKHTIECRITKFIFRYSQLVVQAIANAISSVFLHCYYAGLSLWFG